jgi:hypothetical protein
VSIEIVRHCGYVPHNSGSLSGRIVTPQPSSAEGSAKVRLELQPYITLLEVHYAVDDLLLAAKKGDDRLRAEASNAVEIHPRHTVRLDVRGLKPQRQYIAVHRMKCSVYYKTLPREQFQILRALQRGATLEKACAVLLKRRGDAGKESATDIQQWFAAWASFGWFCQP